MARKLFSSLSFAVFLSSLTCISGCGGGGTGNRATVSGTVKFDGQPIEEGQITFTPTGKTGTIVGGAIKAGAYSIPVEAGPEPGEHKVAVTASRKTGKQIEAIMPAPAGTMIDVTEMYVPKKYNAETTLRFDVKAGDNKDANFDLTK